jgi:hypothetical protein
MPRTSLDQIEEILAILSSPFALKNYHQSRISAGKKNPAEAGLGTTRKTLLD